MMAKRYSEEIQAFSSKNIESRNEINIEIKNEIPEGSNFTNQEGNLEVIK